MYRASIYCCCFQWPLLFHIVAFMNTSVSLGNVYLDVTFRLLIGFVGLTRSFLCLMCGSKSPNFFLDLLWYSSLFIVIIYFGILRKTIYHHQCASSLHHTSIYHHANYCTQLFKNRVKVSRHCRVHLLLCHSITCSTWSISFYSAYQGHTVYHRLLLIIIKYPNVLKHNI